MGGENDRVTARTVFGTPAPVRTPPLAGTATVPSTPREAEIALAPGMRIHQYELIRELGRGGMGVVWAARDVKLGRRVAMKLVTEAAPALAERFLIEAQATAQCTHDNIVIIHAVDDHRGIPYMVLEFLEGQTLREVMWSVPRLPATRVIELMLPVARALSRAHELGIVHRDLKPENVIVTNAGHVKVLDFGIAKALSDKATINRDTLNEQTMVGTLAYMSPEQMGFDQVDDRSDVWAAGIMMFEMVAGAHPVESPSPGALLTNGAAEAEMRSVRDAAPDVSDGLAQVIDGCLRKRKTERLTSVELVRALELLVPGRAGRLLGDGESPYPGLTSFLEGDADRFYGRSREIARMVARVREQPLTGIVGPSGAGKSSFVRAGLGPALKASGDRWDVITLRPGRNPLVALANALHGTTRGEPEDLAGRLLTEPGLLGERLRARANIAETNILVFVDQLEELYTLVGDGAVRRAFTAALTGIADDAATPLRVVVSMRSDFLDRVSEDPQFADELSRGLVFLSTPDRAGLREAIVQPIDAIGYRFETDAIVNDMLDALGGTPGALPLLQFAASQLWDARDRGRRCLTSASYAAIGGVSGALATHADDVVAGMNPAAQKLTHRIFRALVTPERTRAIVELADLRELARDGGELSHVIDQLVAARLLVVQTRGDSGGSVEIVHESLIERWPALRRWLDEDQEDAAFHSQLAAAARQWDAKRRPAGLLWRGGALEEARRWLDHRPRDLAERERAFLDGAFAIARRGRRARIGAVVGGFVVLAAIAAGAIASRASIKSAKDEATAARDEATTAKDQAIASAAREKDLARTAQTALAAAENKERERLAAEAKTAAVEQDSAQKDVAANAEIAESREELQAKNTKLVRTAHEADAAKARAEQSAADAEKAKLQLQQALAREHARVKQLEDERAKLATQLKE